jgi:hypothetical protein
MQYARNGIYNCLQSERHIIQLRHALYRSKGYEERVPLDKFVKTFDNYQAALDWIDECYELKEEVRRLKSAGELVDYEMPEYPSPDYDYGFDGYVTEICRSVKMQMAKEKKSEAEKELHLNVSVNKEFKQFCSYIVYEAILRIGNCLRESVEQSGVKTISDDIVMHVIRQIHHVCGLNFDAIEAEAAKHGMSMEQRLAKYAKWKATRKEKRKDIREKNKNGKTTVDAEVDEDVSDDDAEEDTEEVNEEDVEEVNEEDVEEVEEEDVEVDAENDGDPIQYTED